MKYLLLLIVTCILISCESTWYNEYKIKNDTFNHVTIKAFDTDNEYNQQNDTIEIEPYSEYSVIKADGFHGEEQGIFYGSAIDSVTIVFDSIKIIIQSCDYNDGVGCSFSRNIMDYNNADDFVANKRGKSQGHDEYCYTYTITEEDYNNATLIE